jgi:hypothetical protein
VDEDVDVAALYAERQQAVAEGEAAVLALAVALLFANPASPRLIVP